MVDIVEKHAICLKAYRLQSFLSIQYVHGDLCKHLGIDSSTDNPDRYSNLLLNAYINRDLCKHSGIDSSTDNPDRYSNLLLNAYINRLMHAEYLKMI